MVGRALIFLSLLNVLLVSSKPILSEAFDGKEINLPQHLLIEKVEREIAQILSNTDLAWRQRNKQIDQVYESVPSELLAQLPLSPDYNHLPKDVYAKINGIHKDKNVKLRDRREQIRRILDHLTWEQRVEMNKNDLPLEPPAEFEKVLGAEVFDQLLMIHQNPEMSVDQKKQAIDKVMALVPQQTINRLPLPESFTRLPVEIQRNLRKLLYNFNMEWDARFLQLRQYIRTLPKAYRRILRAGTVPNKIDEQAKFGGSSKYTFSFSPKMEPFNEQTTKQVPV
ncbi:hypothetical protein M3Y97_00525100 [Aphelenchoides bicaudatus]|nr:hypothetical protein M3Y97_00525100 [Aphelenchoides bicaudatus]